jgi:hypothetical protein
MEPLLRPFCGVRVQRIRVMHMQPDVVDYASRRTPRPPMDLLRYAPLFAAVFAGMALLQSMRLDDVMYDEYGHSDEHTVIWMAVILTVPCLILTFARFPRYRSGGRRKLIAAILLCVIVLVCDALAVWNTAAWEPKTASLPAAVGN